VRLTTVLATLTGLGGELTEMPTGTRLTYRGELGSGSRTDSRFCKRHHRPDASGEPTVVPTTDLQEEP